MPIGTINGNWREHKNEQIMWHKKNGKLIRKLCPRTLKFAVEPGNIMQSFSYTNYRAKSAPNTSDNVRNTVWNYILWNILRCLQQIISIKLTFNEWKMGKVRPTLRNSLSAEFINWKREGSKRNMYMSQINCLRCLRSVQFSKMKILSCEMNGLWNPFNKQLIHKVKLLNTMLRAMLLAMKRPRRFRHIL